MDLRRRLKLHAWLHLLLWVAIVLVANHISSGLFARIDLTADQRYTLSPVSRDVVGKLDKPLVARMYFTANLEAPYHDHETQVRAMLEELRAYSGGKLEIESVDPTGSGELKEEAQRFGVQPMQLRYRDQDRVSAREVFMGVSLIYGDKQVPVDAIAQLDTLEYQLVRALNLLVSKPEDRKVIGYLQGDGEPDLARFDPENPIGRIREGLRQRYDLRPVVLGGDEGVPDDVDALIVLGPSDPVPDRSQYQIDQFLMRGGGVAFFLSTMRPDWERMRTKEVPHNLNGLLGHYGVKLGKDSVFDRRSNERIPFPVQVGGRMQVTEVNHPLVPVTTAIDRSVAAVKGLERVVVPFTSTVSLGDAIPPSIDAKVWVRSMPKTSAAVQSLVHITPDVFGRPVPGEVPGPHGLVVGLAGRFSSFFADRPVPPTPNGKDDPTAKILDGSPARLLVAGSADLPANNEALVLNAADWLVEDDRLIEIRSKNTAAATLDAPDALNAWKLGIALIPIGLLLLLALAVYLRARRG